MGFIKWTVLVFGFVLGIIIVIILIGFVIYRASRKKDDMGFQDFLIDSIFHAKSHPEKAKQAPSMQSSTPSGESIVVVEKKNEPPVDPLGSMQPSQISVNTDPMAVFTQKPAPEETVTPVQESPLTDNHASIPDWLKPQNATENTETMSAGNEPIDTITETPLTTPEDTLSNEKTEDRSEVSSTDTVVPQDLVGGSGDIPDWLKWSAPLDTVAATTENSPISSEETATAESAGETTPEVVSIPETSPAPLSEQKDENNLPDWLVDSVSNPSPMKSPEKKSSPKAKKPKTENKSSEEKQSTEETNSTPKTETSSDLPDWLK